MTSFFLQFFLFGALKNEKKSMKLLKLGVKWNSQNSPALKFRKSTHELVFDHFVKKTWMADLYRGNSQCQINYSQPNQVHVEFITLARYVFF